MRIILPYEEMSLFNIRCLRLNFIFLLREFWNDIIIPNFISKKNKTMDDIMFMIMQNFYKKWTRIAYCPWIGALSKHQHNEINCCVLYVNIKNLNRRKNQLNIVCCYKIYYIYCIYITCIYIYMIYNNTPNEYIEKQKMYNDILPVKLRKVLKVFLRIKTP